MGVRESRLQRGWSQEQLAQLSGLSVRTIQRIEQGQSAGVESYKSLAAVFGVSFHDLQQETEMSTQLMDSGSGQDANPDLRDAGRFYRHLARYLLVMALLFTINLAGDSDYLWAWWPALGWGLGVAMHAVRTFLLPVRT